MSTSLFHALNISRQDMLARLQDLNVISNNLANLNTAGFKSSRSEFQELLSSAQLEGITIPGTQNMQAQGALSNTGNPLDWAIQGNGFYPVQMSDGRTAYTRDGQLHLDSSRNLVTSHGEKLVWQGQIPVTFSSITVGQDGKVMVTNMDGTQTVAGQVQLARFANPAGLLGQGSNLWVASPPSGPAVLGTPGSANFGVLAPGYVETSNVDITREMTTMTSDQRTFQMSVQAFQQTDNMISLAINLRKA
jgi:flagellar basal-body rod protein FlgG